MVLFIDPIQEGLLVVKDSSSLGPVTLHACGDEILVTGDKEEVVVHRLLAYLLLHLHY